MKTSLFSFLSFSAVAMASAIGQTNTTPVPSPAPAAPTVSTPLTPPPDTAAAASATSAANVPPTVTAPVPTPTMPPPPSPAVTAPVVAAPAPSSPTITPRPAPPARGVAKVAAPAHPRRPYHLTRISWIVATRDQLHVDDRYVTIIGHVTRRIGDDEYWFSDGTGSVRLDSENFDLPIGPRLVVGGRIDQAWLGFGHLEVDVLRWRYDR
jgi:uncharacterized protein YdeI (BOF family)